MAVGQRRGRARVPSGGRGEFSLADLRLLQLVVLEVELAAVGRAVGRARERVVVRRVVEHVDDGREVPESEREEDGGLSFIREGLARVVVGVARSSRSTYLTPRNVSARLETSDCAHLRERENGA